MFCTGDIVDQYRLTGQLGSGSYGMVFAAENTVSRQRCAIKFVPLCGRSGERELHALQQTRGLEHPNLLKIHHAGIFGDYLYYTMDLADGKIADQHLAPAELRSAAADLADALASLHAKGLIHRDVKPDNLLWRNGRVLLADVGLLTVSSKASMVGTPGFLPPSVRSNDTPLSEFSDIYALAKSFYCLLSGNPPEKYPQYAGPVTAESSSLLQTILAVCGENSTIRTAAMFRDRLREKFFPIRLTHKRWQLAAGMMAMITIIVATAIFIGRQTLFTPTKSGEKITEPMRKMEADSGAEKEAISCQQRVFDDLKSSVDREVKRRYPSRQITSIGYETRRAELRRKLLDRAVQERAQQYREFRCFYQLRGELIELGKSLQALLDRPECKEQAVEKLRLWQQKHAAYCKQRDRLLK